MEKSIKLFIDNKGVKNGFPIGMEQIEISAFTADYKRMGNAPTITCTVKHHTCLDKLWTYGVYTIFNNEKFYLKKIPSSSFSNKDARYIHELELCSERVQLDNVFVFDVVSNREHNRPVSNNTVFSFFGTIEEFANRLNHSLVYTNLQKVDENGTYISGYKVIVDNGIVSEGKLVSIENKVFSEVLQESFNTYEIPYYFIGKEIHIGYAPNAINEVFKYGVHNSLLSIKKENANTKIINRITGFGSEDNLPYYYPNKTSLGDVYLTYNNDKGKAVIGDQAKFSKNKLSSVFVYSQSDAISVSIVKSIRVLNDKWSGTDEYWQGIRLVSFDYEVELEITEEGSGTTIIYNNTLFLSTMYENAVLYSEINEPEEKEIAKWNHGIKYLETDESGNTIAQLPKELYSLTKGKYRCVVKVVALENNFSTEDFLNNYVQFSATFNKEATSCWKLENKTISSISDYGITVLVSPQRGDEIRIVQNADTWIVPQKKLMPPKYRETFGAERFYNAENNKYTDPETDKEYEFSNLYVDGNPREHIAEFEEIKPSIEDITNKDGENINSFLEFFYDKNDNDEKDEEGNYIHPYFFAKLRKFNGQKGDDTDNGFNLFEHSIESGEMTISMTSGNCGGCQWVIGVDADTKKNLVQVEKDKNGKWIPKVDNDGNVICGREGQSSVTPQDAQQDTINNEVWIALLKDNQTFHTIMPNATNNYKPSVGDTFVILNIHLPHSYIIAAEHRLENEIIRYMHDNNNEKFDFSIDFSKIYFAENEDVLSHLNENSVLTIEYNKSEIQLYVNSFTYSIKENDVLPEIKVTLTKDIDVSNNAIQEAVTQVETQILNKISDLDIQTLGAPYFHRKDIPDQTSSTQTFTEGIKIGKEKEYGIDRSGVATVSSIRTKDFQRGFVGAGIYQEGLNTHAEFDYINIRKKATFKEVEIQETRHIGGKLELTAAECKCEVVEEIKNNENNVVAYKVYFRRYSGDDELITNKWQIGDQARCDTFNLEQNKDGSLGNRYYWRLVTDVGTGGYNLKNENMAEYHWIVLSNNHSETITLDGKTISNTIGFDVLSSKPLVGDSIIQLGNRFGVLGRISAIELAGAGEDSPYIRQYTDITTFSLGDVDTQIKPNDNKFKGYVAIEGGTGAENLADLPVAVQKAAKVGGENLLRNTGFDGDYESQRMEDFGEINAEDVTYNPLMEFWGKMGNGGYSVEDNNSVSGRSCEFAAVNDGITQEVELIKDEHYIVTFKSIGRIIVFYGDKSISLGQTGESKSQFDFIATGKTTFRFIGATAGAKVWEIKLERGTIATDWCPAREDSDRMADNFKELWYLQHAIKGGKTEILNGLILSTLIELGMYRNGVMEQVTAGISGILEDENTDVAFWGGGTLAQAINAVAKYKTDPTYQPTEEELSEMAKVVFTHGGRGILNDVILRGYVYALGGRFKGRVEAEDGYFKGRVEANEGIFKGEVHADKGYFLGSTRNVMVDITPNNYTQYLTEKSATEGNYYVLDFDKTGYCIRFSGDFTNTFGGTSALNLNLPILYKNDGQTEEEKDKVRAMPLQRVLIYNNADNLNLYVMAMKFTNGYPDKAQYQLAKDTFGRFIGEIGYINSTIENYKGEAIIWDVRGSVNEIEA